MPKLKFGRAPARKPTPFADLNAVLTVMVDGVRQVLGDTFVGAYLQGSFAVGDADANSDCDFIVVIRRDLTPEEIAAIDAMHTAIHDLPYEPWRHRLEGSYVPEAILRRYTLEPRDPPDFPRGPDWGDPGTSGTPPRAYPFVYLDHAAKTTVRSEHDNTQVVRWCLREKGVVLAGPDPKRLIDPVSPAVLRAEVRATMDLCLSTGLEPMEAMAAWQTFWVGLFCRILHTLHTGAVASKKSGSAWAAVALDPRWRGLIQRAQASRDGDNAARMVPADPEDVAQTRAFAAYCVIYADRAEKNRLLLERVLADQRQGPKGPVAGFGGRDPGLKRSQYVSPTNRPGGRGRRG
jgi:hypothetical protein